MKLIDQGSTEYRPEYHFTPRKNWMNDPNGLVFFDGEYHLFFQYNPHGKDWGHMSWGHAVSTDLVHWDELPIAMPEREFMIFSGSVVVDWSNTSRLGDGVSPPLVALYTAYHPGHERQAQHLAYSHDRGRTWTDYPGNPVIDLDLEHFRDPKVFWHAASNAWVMVVALAREHKIEIYRSADLTSWDLVSAFGPAGSTSGQWECPDLIEVPIDGGAGTAWALKVDVDRDFVCGGSGAQLFVGTFDGFVFTPDREHGHQIVDVGPDFYAAQSWSDLPEAAGGPLWIGWMSNHLTGKAYPTHPWRGAMTAPRQLRFKTAEEGLVLAQEPASLFQAAVPAIEVEGVLAGGESLMLGDLAEPFLGQAVLTVQAGSHGTLLFAVDAESGSGIRIAFDLDAREIHLRRGSHPDMEPEAFAAKSSNVLPGDEPLSIRIVNDRSSVEVFIGDGRQVLTACYFAVGQSRTQIVAEPGARFILGSHNVPAYATKLHAPVIR
ncbi:levanase/fructan beta-fructosidase [Sphingomonas zeicaulis]|uniref:GH32 C-terminal domain-containing protein n=1 Tax=Sphingomonas zeicaulis TaxID=1632740 RepID=UPI003D1F63C3